MEAGAGAAKRRVQTQNSGSEAVSPLGVWRAGRAFQRGRCFLQHFFKRLKIFQKPFAAVVGQEDRRARLDAHKRFFNADRLSFFQHLEMPAQIAVGEGALLLEMIKGEAIGHTA